MNNLDDSNQTEQTKRSKTETCIGPRESPVKAFSSATNRSMSEVINVFSQNIATGPEYICTCCDQLWYKSSVTKCNPTL